MNLPRHNTTIEFADHYVSYNFGDRKAYGSDTTAIVIGQMQRFYILNGDHREQLSKLPTFEEKIEYFLKNAELKNKRSDAYDATDARIVMSAIAA